MRIGIAMLLIVAAAGCGGGWLRQYEYEEELFLSLDRSATVHVNSSVPALNALRGTSFDPRPETPVDREALREYFTTPATRVTRVTASRRNGRRFVHVRLDVADVRQLGAARPFAWSSYGFESAGGSLGFDQVVGPSAATSAGDPSWTGQELVAFRVHIPSRVVFHNAGAGNLKRGNILVWEQPLAERLKSIPVTLEARMEPRSILYSTLLLFGVTVAAVVMLFAALVWWVVRTGRTRELMAKG